MARRIMGWGTSSKIIKIATEPLGKFVDTRFVLHYYGVMKNITITLDEKVARWARIRAAEENTSVSRLVGNLLRDKMNDEKDYLIAMQQYLSQPPGNLRNQAPNIPPGRSFMPDKVFVDTNVFVYSREVKGTSLSK